MNTISYALPAIIASYILIKLESKEKLISFVTAGGLFAILIFILNSGVLLWMFDYPNRVIDFTSTSMTFTVRYLLLSLFWTAILPPLIWNIKKNIQVRVKEKIVLKNNSQ